MIRRTITLDPAKIPHGRSRIGDCEIDQKALAPYLVMNLKAETLHDAPNRALEF
jgi:hypothetical protein